VAWEEKICVDVDREDEERRRLIEYKSKLVYNNTVLPDPFTLTDNDWVGEEDGIGQWPLLFFTDITDYLRCRTPAELRHRLCNEYKEGKAYRYES